MTTVRDTLAQALQDMHLPQEACHFLLMIWDVAQFLDDVQDGDEPDKRMIYTLAVGMAADPFLARFREALVPALSTMYHKWQAANAAETDKLEAHLDKAYIWRAGYYDVVLLVASLCLPREVVEGLALHILTLYGETREDYVKEITDA